MGESMRELGTKTVIMQRIHKQYLPQLEQMKRRLDRGECLNDYDMSFLERIIANSREWQWRFSGENEQRFFSRLSRLYLQVMQQALENEQSKQ